MAMRHILAAVVAVSFASAAWGQEYLVGGPLAGLKLPGFPTQHGEQAGYPGCIPELIAKAQTVRDMDNEYRQWGPQGQAPEMDLYDGSVEHYRAYMFKYMPIRSFFDRQSQRKRFTAPALPGAAAGQAEQYAEPVYWVPRHDDPMPTGRFDKPVPVVRMKAGAPVLKLDLGELPVGLYVVRVIGAVETKAIRPFRRPLFMRMKVNDAPDGAKSDYRMRLGYCDQFYSVAEFYFHAPRARAYRAELAVDRGSDVDLLVHTVSLDDVLAGTVPRAIKTRTTVGEAVSSAQPADLDKAKRFARDAGLWRGLPPVNAQGSGIGVGHGGYGSIRGVSAGADKLDGKEIVERYGDWVPWGRETRDMKLPDGVEGEDVFLANPKLGLVYTADDLARNRPLPDPYPFKDDGGGLYYPDPADPAKGRAWTPIGLRVSGLHREYYNAVGAALKRFRQKGSYDDAHDAALTLLRWAYAFPTLDYSEYLSNTVHEVGPFGRDYSCRRRETTANFLPHYMLYVRPIMFEYDELFEFIRGNRLLAESVGRFVPWVKAPQDLIRLIDVYLVQTTAKRILRYHYHTDPMDIANLAAVVGDTSVTDPWMEWLFSRTFIYPLPVAGIQDTMITGTTREGTEFVGSTYYAQGEGAYRVAEALDMYHAAGGNRRFDLSDPARYPKPIAHAYWRIENVVGGWDFLRIGDVCGPDKVPGHTLRELDFALAGWRWTHQPEFAFILKHCVGRQGIDDKEWSAIEAAAAKCPRAPWLDNPSRVLPMWAGVLEAGREHDDPRFRRAAYLRVGYGVGHQHDDTLDLQVVAHGLPMTIDGGQRPGYSSPGDRTTRVHNTVEVDGRGHCDHSWVTALADHAGARYLSAEGTPPPGATRFGRRIALIDADDEPPPQKLAPPRHKPVPDLPKCGATPNSYVLDVFAVAGGGRHTYCFHGPLHDDFQWNAKNPISPPDTDDEGQYLAMFRVKPELSAAGAAPADFQATWRMALDVPGPGAGEKEILGRSYDPDSPRKFTRLHLPGVEGARAFRGQAVCRQWKYDFTQVMVQRKGEGLRTAFAAVIEPYAGKPFLASVRRVAVKSAGADGGLPVLVEVKTTSGRTDLCFAGDAADVPADAPEAKFSAGAEFAYVSADQAGLRQATLVGGKSLQTPLVRLEAAEALRQASVVKVDYLAKRLWLDGRWPAGPGPMVFEIGLPGTDHWTTYTAVGAEAAGDGTVLTLQRGADAYRSEVTRVEADGTVECTLKPMLGYVQGNQAGWVASDDDATRLWRARYLGKSAFRLTPSVGAGQAAQAVTREAFGKAGVLRLWEYGVGDTARRRTSVCLRRLAGGEFELAADTDVKLSLRAASAELSADGKTWQAAPGRSEDGWFAFDVPLDRLARGRLLIRVRP